MAAERVQRVHSSVGVVLLGTLVQRDALCSSVHEAEPGDSKFFSGLHDRGHPAADAARLEGLCALRVGLLGHHLASLVLHEVSLDESALGELLRAVPHLEHGSGLHFLGHALRLAGLFARIAFFEAFSLGARGFVALAGLGAFGFATRLAFLAARRVARLAARLLAALGLVARRTALAAIFSSFLGVSEGSQEVFSK